MSPHGVLGSCTLFLNNIVVFKSTAAAVEDWFFIFFTFLLCLLQWNTVEKTWDCPCHGSHFDSCGKVINGPAKADLAKVDW